MESTGPTDIGYRLLFAVLIFTAFWIASHLAQAAVNRLADRSQLHQSLRSLLRQAFRYGLLALGAVSALGTMGVDTGAIVAGLGLTGFAFGFALKDALANLVAGVLILIYRPFKSGDHIEVGGKKGVVATIDLRYTELAVEGNRVLIPNQAAFNNTVVVQAGAAGG